MRIAWLIVALSLCHPAMAQQPSQPHNYHSGEITARELHSLMNERDRAQAQRFQDQEKAVSAALAAAKEAVAKAEAAAEKRYESLNEFRGTLKDQQATLIPRAEVMAMMKAIEDKQRFNDERLSRLISRGEGVNWIIGMIGAAIGGVVGLIAAAATIWKRRAPV